MKSVSGSEQHRDVLESKEILQDKQLPISLKKQGMDQFVLPTMANGCQTWSLKKQLTDKLRTSQKATESKMLKLQDKVPCQEIRKITKIVDIIEYILKTKIEMCQIYSKNEGQ